MRFSITHLGLTLLLAGGLRPPATSQDAVPSSGETRAEALLAAMGGREAWSRVAFVHVEAVHDDLDISESFVNRIWNDLSEPRVRFTAENARFRRSHWIGGGAGARELESGTSTPLTEAQYASERAWWEANVYRTLQRIARRDPALGFRAVGGSRLEVLRPDGTVLNWFVLNQKGEPMLFGSGGDALGTAFGPLSAAGGVRYPKWGARADGSWRYEIVRFEALSAVPAATFSSSNRHE